MKLTPGLPDSLDSQSKENVPCCMQKYILAQPWTRNKRDIQNPLPDCSDLLFLVHRWRFPISICSKENFDKLLCFFAVSPSVFSRCYSLERISYQVYGRWRSNARSTVGSTHLAKSNFSGFNFINVLHEAFLLIDPKSVKKYS